MVRIERLRLENSFSEDLLVIIEPEAEEIILGVDSVLSIGLDESVMGNARPIKVDLVKRESGIFLIVHIDDTSDFVVC